MSGVRSRVKPAVCGVCGAADAGANQQNQTGSERAAESASNPDPAAAGVLLEIPGETSEGTDDTVPEKSYPFVSLENSYTAK